MKYVVIESTDPEAADAFVDDLRRRLQPPDPPVGTLRKLDEVTAGTGLRWEIRRRRLSSFEDAVLRLASAYAFQDYDGVGIDAPVLTGSARGATEVERALAPLEPFEGWAVLAFDGAAKVLHRRPDVVRVELSATRAAVHAEGRRLAMSVAVPPARIDTSSAAALATRLLAAL